MELLSQPLILLGCRDRDLKREQVYASPDSMVCPLHTGFVVHGKPQLEHRLKLKVFPVEEPCCDCIASRQLFDQCFSQALATLGFHGSYKPGSGVWIYRNVIDLRRPVPYIWPAKTDDPNFPPPKPGEPRRWPWTGRMCGDHGSPIWEPIHFYHNTVVVRDPAFRDYYAAGWGGHVNSRRWIFNNVLVQLEGKPGLQFDPPSEALLSADGNLLWSLRDGASVKGNFFAAFRRSDRFTRSKKHYPPGWGASDRFADPKLTRLSADWRGPLDVRLQEGSPAIDSGVSLPEDWPDPVRKQDRGKPDIGALPLGAEAFKAGR